MPGRCVQIGRGEARRGEPWSEARWRLDCGGRSLVGERVGVEGLALAQTDALLPAELRAAAGYATLISQCKQTYCFYTCTCSDPRYGC